MASSKDLALSFASEIRQKHSEAVAADETLRRALNDKLEKTRAVGVVLESAKHDLHHKDWERLCKELPFSLDSVRSYLKFAQKHPEPVADLKVAMRAAAEAALATGALPAPDGHGLQKLHQPNFFAKLTLIIQSIGAEWVRFLRARPLAGWPDELKWQFLETLRPILKIHKEVRASIGSSGNQGQ